MRFPTNSKVSSFMCKVRNIAKLCGNCHFFLAYVIFLIFKIDENTLKMYFSVFWQKYEIRKFKDPPNMPNITNPENLMYLKKSKPQPSFWSIQFTSFWIFCNIACWLFPVCLELKLSEVWQCDSYCYQENFM